MPKPHRRPGLIGGFAALCLALVLVAAVPAATQPGALLPTTTAPPNHDLYLPCVLHTWPTPPPPPPKSKVFVDNDTGGQLCYEVFNTGIGRQCFPVGKHFYGSFKAGTYTYKATARCGKITDSTRYPAGDFTHRFWCQ